jgi:N-hydroxyarylamine O-acetyltransferase
MTNKALTSTRVDEVVELLGFDARPDADLDGLHDVYRAWCRRIPFDNLRKLVALHFEMPEIPGIDPADFFAAWQFTGAGATCWGGNNAIHALLIGLGFDARLHAASMSDAEVNHGTTIVEIDGDRFMVDTAILTDAPVPLIPETPASVDHEGYVTRAVPDPAGWLIDCQTREPDVRFPCRIHDEMDHAASVAANEKSRTWSPFNDGIMAKINDASGTWWLKDGELTRIDRSGTTSSKLSDAEIDEFLVETTGHLPQLVAEVRGVLDFQASDPDSGS